MFVPIVTLGLLGVTLTALLRLVETYVAPWTAHPQTAIESRTARRYGNANRRVLMPHGCRSQLRSSRCRCSAAALCIDAGAARCRRAGRLHRTMRKINVGVSVVAAECGAHHALCGQGARHLRQALHRRQHHPVRRRRVAGRHRGGRAGHARSSNVSDVAIGRGMKAKQFWGLAPRPPQAYAVAREHQDRGRPQGQAPERGRRRRRQLQLAHGPRGAASAGLDVDGRPVHLPGHRRPAAGPGRRPARRRGAASRRTSIWRMKQKPGIHS